MPFHWPSSRYLLGVPRQKPGEIRLELTSQARLDPVHTCHQFDSNSSARRQIDDCGGGMDGAEKRRLFRRLLRRRMVSRFAGAKAHAEVCSRWLIFRRRRGMWRCLARWRHCWGAGDVSSVDLAAYGLEGK